MNIDPCIPRWWREYEISYRRGSTTYRIKVENPLGISRGIATIELDGAIQKDGGIPLTDDGKTHIVRVVLGERASSDSEAEAQATSPRKA